MKVSKHFVFLLFLLYDIQEGQRNYDDFLSHLYVMLCFGTVEQKMSNYDQLSTDGV